jgi:hypothetical protein
MTTLGNFMILAKNFFLTLIYKTYIQVAKLDISTLIALSIFIISTKKNFFFWWQDKKTHWERNAKEKDESEHREYKKAQIIFFEALSHFFLSCHMRYSHLIMFLWQWETRNWTFTKIKEDIFWLSMKWNKTSRRRYANNRIFCLWWMRFVKDKMENIFFFI